ncbi:MAG TPA: TonB family protein [Terriglobales bacterium]|jgi:TonB family protein|nr:TonB family protein [Terriglobales bacterium]
MTLDLELEESVAEPVVSEPAFLIELEPRRTAFLRNLRDLFWTPRLPPLRLLSYPSAPWPDVFVPTKMPWRGFSSSLAGHVFVVVILFSFARIFPDRHAIVDHPSILHDQLVYYSPAEYLAPLDTGSAPAEKSEKGDPEFARQPIISVPRQADNHVQTVATPPNVKLDRDVPLPNIVAWTQTPQAVPLAATTRNTADRKAPALETSVVAPTPEVNRTLDRRAQSLTQDVVAPAPDVTLAATRQVLQSPQAAVVAPAPQVNAQDIRRMGDLNIGHSDAVAPAPQLPTAERSVGSRVGPMNAGSAVVPPPPVMQSPGGAEGGGRVIALNVRPLAPNSAAEIPSGNRRGSFAATPEGKPGAAGTPQVNGKSGNAPDAGKGSGTGAGAGSGKAADAPAGLYVGSAPKNATTGATTGGTSASEPPMMASVTPPRVTTTPPGPTATPSVDNPTPAEREVFGDRKFYRMNINVPNLNSSGGSWVFRFAELKDDGEGDLSSPVAIRTADPGYPLELMRHNAQGTVTLYAVIHTDGSVNDVKVLQSVDDRLDPFAAAALAKWKFRPATKNGSPVALETVVVIPFKPGRAAF